MIDLRVAEVINKFTERSVLKEVRSKVTIIFNPPVNAQIHIVLSLRGHGWRSMEIVALFIAFLPFVFSKYFDESQLMDDWKVGG